MNYPDFQSPQQGSSKVVQSDVLEFPYDEMDRNSVVDKLGGDQSALLTAFTPLPPSLPHYPWRGITPIGPPHLRTFKARLPEHLRQHLGYIMGACDRHAASHGGWATGLFSLTKQDISLADIPELSQLSHEITTSVTDTARDLFGADVFMDRNQPHVLKYDANHRMTPFHQDQNHLTINVMLSDRGTYRGGGTFLLDIGNVVLDAGEYLIHPGPLLHRGCEIQSGTRYLMVFFVNFLHTPLPGF